MIIGLRSDFPALSNSLSMFLTNCELEQADRTKISFLFGSVFVFSLWIKASAIIFGVVPQFRLLGFQ